MDWEQIAEYHREHGDDYGSRGAQSTKYDVLLAGLAEHTALRGRAVLDVGCGSEQLRPGVEAHAAIYTGIDLVRGENVLDYHKRHDFVVANGIFYKLKLATRAPEISMQDLICHMWYLARECLAFNSLSTRAESKYPGDFYADPIHTYQFCESLANKIVLRHDYLPYDFTIFLYR